MKTLILLIVLPCLLLPTGALQPEENPTAKFFLKSYSTTTFTMLSTFTTVVPYQCFLTSATPQACVGRKLRRLRKISVPGVESPASGIDPSVGDLIEDVAEQVEKEVEGDERFFFTLWRTSTSTATVTTTSTNSAITISASAFCTYTGFTGPLC